jgi:hypothetical protein
MVSDVKLLGSLLEGTLRTTEVVFKTTSTVEILLTVVCVEVFVTAYDPLATETYQRTSSGTIMQYLCDQLSLYFCDGSVYSDTFLNHPAR